jgi:hypothetical protein
LSFAFFAGEEMPGLVWGDRCAIQNTSSLTIPPTTAQAPIDSSPHCGHIKPHADAAHSSASGGTVKFDVLGTQRAIERAVLLDCFRPVPPSCRGRDRYNASHSRTRDRKHHRQPLPHHKPARHQSLSFAAASPAPSLCFAMLRTTTRTL